MQSNSSRLLPGILLFTAVIYGVVPPIVDWSPTHAFHPDWPPHARFHMVWLLGTNSTLALIVVFLVLKPAGDRILQLRIASLLGVAAFAGFVVATILQPSYAGALHDPTGGVPPIMGVDANLLTFTPAIMLQLFAVWLAFRAKPAG